MMQQGQRQKKWQLPKKYYDFEMKYSCNNDDDLLERLKQKAAEYVEHGKIVSN